MVSLLPLACEYRRAHARPPDPILGVQEAYEKDTSANKLNLGVGES